MNPLYQPLHDSLLKGYIDYSHHSENELLPQLFVNSQGKKFLTAVEANLQSCSEFWFSVAFVTTSGVAALTNTLLELNENGIKGKLLVSSYLNFTQPEALRKLLKFKNIELRICEDGDFHSKGYLFKNGHLYDLIIGSSNLTGSALCTNKEWNLKVSASPGSYLIENALTEFKSEFETAKKVDDDYIFNYEKIYKKQFEYNNIVRKKIFASELIEIKPNAMQVEALANLNQIRALKKNKALLISATGTGKTYLSAFDAHKVSPKKLLFVVHRLTIAEAAMKTYEKVFRGSKITMGLYSGNIREINKDFIFCTIQTLSKQENLSQFRPDEFDYIVIDESHRAGADSYQKILSYFTPHFLLGMTATPERTDGLDIFSLYDHIIAYEIRLHKAMEERMLSPFHYYGISEIKVNGIVLDDNSSFSLLTSKERVEHILEKSKFYGTDSGQIRGLVFCSKVDECLVLSMEFNKRGYKTVALTGESSEAQRAAAINNLESDSLEDKIDYIFTRDIFNEGVDIPKANQIIMLRPTQSAIVFVQQLGRGLRKTENKDYLTVLDFIGNYANNYLVPIALFGDTSYNKDSLRKCMVNGSSIIPGESTINFDQITKDRIFESINSANMQMKKDLINDYKLLKYKLGRIPEMVDFLEHGSRDPMLYVNYSRSYFNFIELQEESLLGKVNESQRKYLELFSSEINNGKRIEESIILKSLFEASSISVLSIKNNIQDLYGYLPDDKSIASAISNLNFEFVAENLKWQACFS